MVLFTAPVRRQTFIISPPLLHQFFIFSRRLWPLAYEKLGIDRWYPAFEGAKIIRFSFLPLSAGDHGSARSRHALWKRFRTNLQPSPATWQAPRSHHRLANSGATAFVTSSRISSSGLQFPSNPSFRNVTTTAGEFWRLKRGPESNGDKNCTFLLGRTSLATDGDGKWIGPADSNEQSHLQGMTLQRWQHTYRDPHFVVPVITGISITSRDLDDFNKICPCGVMFS